jgi:hypothetical protein
MPAEENARQSATASATVDRIQSTGSARPTVASARAVAVAWSSMTMTTCRRLAPGTGTGAAVAPADTGG